MSHYVYLHSILRNFVRKAHTQMEDMVCALNKTCLIVSNSATPWTVALCPWDSLGRNTGVGCHALLQGIFPTQGSNPGLLHCRQIFFLNHLSYQGNPRRHGANRLFPGMRGSTLWAVQLLQCQVAPGDPYTCLRPTCLLPLCNRTQRLKTL